MVFGRREAEAGERGAVFYGLDGFAWWTPRWEIIRAERSWKVRSRLALNEILRVESACFRLEKGPILPGDSRDL